MDSINDHLRDQLTRLAQIVETVARQQVETWRSIRETEARLRKLETPPFDITLP